jgi:hypothetical protein
MRSVLEVFGVDSQVAQRIWPGPEVVGNTIVHQNATGIEDPRTRRQFEEAVGGALREGRDKVPPNPETMGFIRGVLGQHGVLLTTDREV